MNKKLTQSQIYNEFMLRFYDLTVLQISNKFIWRCPTENLLDFFNKHITSNHLDIGVGTGYYLDKCIFPSKNPRIGLMDISSGSLKATQKRINRYSPESYHQNILEKITAEIEPFQSISMNYLIHCIPGNMDEKLKIFENVQKILLPNGIIFGSTLIFDENQNRIAKKLMQKYNEKGIFNNYHDSREGLEKNLAKYFNHFETQKIGSAILFTGQN